MNHDLPHRPRVSRETRLLLATALLSVAMLWILARIRFPDQPAAPNPVQPLLTQLAARPRFNELAGEIAQLRPRLEPLLAGPALRIRSDAALMLLNETQTRAPMGLPPDVVTFDPATYLAVVRAPLLPAPPPVPWNPSDLQQARYLVATDVSTGTLSLQPVFVGSLASAQSPLWSAAIWLLPTGTDLIRGTFVFTTDALLAGLVVDHEERPAIVPGAVLLAEGDRLLAPSISAPGELGVEVQALTRPIAKATGAATGVIVAWVDPNGPSADRLAVGDILEATDGDALSTPLHWKAQAARVAVGNAMTVRVRRSGEVRDVVLIAAPAQARPAAARLGLVLRNMPGTGSVVTEVEAGSIAERAGLRTSDVITLAGQANAPSPAVIRRTFDGASEGEAVLVAYVRAGIHAVTALEK